MDLTTRRRATTEDSEVDGGGRIAPMGDRALVLGGSMAGLLAARVLADRYTQVTVVDRDRFPVPGERRRGVPQDRHIHALLTRGKQVIDELFPGASDELVAQGALLGDFSRDTTFVLAGGSRMRKVDTGLELLSVSRPLLEGHLRSRLLDLPNVTAIEGCEVLGLTTDPEARRVTGARVHRRADGAAEETLAANLVVDATGRGSRTPAWLERLGYRPPPEEQVPIDVAYTTCRYPRHPNDTEHAIILDPSPPGKRGGGAIAAEGDSWVVTLIGVLGEHAPTDTRGFVDYAASLPAPDLYELIHARQPLSEPVVMRYPANSRRRYETLARFPEGLVVVGDAVCSFNPIYGQGMSVAAVTAAVLADLLDDGDHRLGPRFFGAIRRTTDVAWDLATGSDAQHPEVDVPRSVMDRLIDAYLDKLTAVAANDSVVAEAFVRVFALVARPETVMHPRIALRVLAGSLRNGRRKEAGRPSTRSRAMVRRSNRAAR